MKRLEQIWRSIKIDRRQPFKPQENSLPTNQAKAPAEFLRIPNPYRVGSPINPRFDHHSLFVGRQGLAVQIEDAIENTKHPTFFVIGERRIGKTSFLMQLPNLLKNFYIPVFCDLQIPSRTFSITYLLIAIAREIYEMVSLRGYRVPELEYNHLLEADKDDELMALHHFEDWLSKVIRAFDRNTHTILLTFDEYEALMPRNRWADESSFNLELLFNWFHKITQSNSRLVFLFCGVTPIIDIDGGEMFSFNNIQTIKIGFLHPSEARQLIMHPVPDFLGEEIFGEDIVEEIIHITGGQPFLIQALCSRLIDRLNTDNQSHIQFEDLASVVEESFNLWEHYFRDLWSRTSKEERLCLSVLNEQGLCDPFQLQQQTGLNRLFILLFKGFYGVT